MYPAGEAKRILGRDVSKYTLVFNSPILSRSGVVLVYDIPELIPHIQTKDYCYGIVHAGYSLVEDHRAQKLVVNEDEYGSYPDYTKNIKRKIFWYAT